MMASKPRLLVCIAIAIPFCVYAQDQCGTSPTPGYVLTAESGAPIPEPSTTGFSYTRKNEDSVLIRLENINPYAFKCSVSTSSTDVKETAIASFLAIIGGVAGSVGGGGSGSTGAITPLVSKILNDNVVKNGHQILSATQVSLCVRTYLNSADHSEITHLEEFSRNINSSIETTQINQNTMLAEFNDRVHGLVELRAGARCTDIVGRAQDLMARPVFNIENVPASPSPLPLEQAINRVAFQAQALNGHLGEGLADACKAEARSFINDDKAFLSALVVGTSSAPSAIEQWRSQLKTLNTVRANIVNAQNSIGAVLANRQNFTIDTSIHGNQQIVTYTATCSPVPVQTIAAPDPAAVASTSPAPPTVPPASGGGSTPATPTSTWKHDFKFGSGPRFVLAGGVVISPLSQVTFSTTATPGGSGATANTIIQQQNSGTRILPIAMLHARYWDQLPTRTWYSFIPNYFSAGVTAKSSDNKGTNIEYLFGPSWAFAERQIFITAGAYAGQQQRLANSLTVGSTTSLSSANLPITQSTIWKAGFAVTWAPGGK
jgi:hypothetical protein